MMPCCVIALMLVYRVVYAVHRLRLFLGLATPPPGVRIVTLPGLLAIVTRSQRRAGLAHTAKHE